MVDGGGIADLIARAVVAAAQVYGDDPAVAMTSKSPPQRRALSAAAAAMAERLGLTSIDAGRLVGVSAVTVENKVRLGDATWRSARNAAIVAIGGTLRKSSPGGRSTPEGRDGDALQRAPLQTSARGIEPPPALRGPPPPTGEEKHMAGPCGRMDGRLPDASPVTPLAPNRASRTVGAPAPRKVDAREKELGRSPADQAGDGFERRFVLECRRRNVPWAHIANQLGGRKTANDLRAIYDPGFDRAAIIAVADAGRVAQTLAAGTARGERGDCIDVLAGSVEHRILRAIQAGCDDGASLGARLGKSAEQASGVVSKLKRKGLVTGLSGRWALTRDGEHQAEHPVAR